MLYISDKRHKKSSKSSDGQRDIAKLERWINKVTDQQSTRYRDNLYTVFNNVLTSKEASRYEKVFKDLALHQSQRQGQRELVQEQFPPLTTFDSHSNRNIMLDLLDPLLQPFILQMRADIRNIFIWLCTGSPGSKIDGQMHEGSPAVYVVVQSHVPRIQKDQCAMHSCRISLWTRKIAPSKMRARLLLASTRPTFNLAPTDPTELKLWARSVECRYSRRCRLPGGQAIDTRRFWSGQNDQV
ncbi:hypothetical protein EDD21DRAFT_89307 [Dissophora ornata]|nr:hypothetical protein EDD21DRAFT_89307 [Dissophora ornata]